MGGRHRPNPTPGSSWAFLSAAFPPLRLLPLRETLFVGFPCLLRVLGASVVKSRVEIEIEIDGPGLGASSWLAAPGCVHRFGTRNDPGSCTRGSE